MNMNSFEPLESLWGDLLSRDPTRVISAFEKIDPHSRLNVIKHLKTMTREKGWHIEQKESARIAAKVIQSYLQKDHPH